jgi:Flp pilus assembly pilin Flp
MLRVLSAGRAFLLGKEEGATPIEYCVLLVLIAAVTIAVMSAFGASLRGVFASLASSI